MYGWYGLGLGSVLVLIIIEIHHRFKLLGRGVATVYNSRHNQLELFRRAAVTNQKPDLILAIGTGYEYG